MLVEPLLAVARLVFAEVALALAAALTATRWVPEYTCLVLGLLGKTYRCGGIALIRWEGQERDRALLDLWYVRAEGEAQRLHSPIYRLD